MVSPNNPLKESSILEDEQVRLQKAKEAIAQLPSSTPYTLHPTPTCAERIIVSDFEFHLPRPSYTANTLRELQKHYPDHEFTLIIGADNWQLFPRWKAADEIISQHQLLVYPRPGYEIDESTLPASVRTVNTPVLEISSTFIRESLAQGKDVRYFLHPKVWERITCFFNE